MPSSVNVVALIGNLGSDPELRTTSGGTSLCKLRLAVNERYKDSSGNWVDRPNWFDITVWAGQGEACAQHLSKGRAVAVQGRLRWREWETDGNKRQAVEVVADTVQFLGSRDGGGGGGSRSDVPADETPPPEQSDVPAQDDDFPF